MANYNYPSKSFAAGSALSTQQVQSFIRFIVFVVTFLILGVLLILPLAALSEGIFGTSGVLVVPMVVLVAAVSGTVSKMFYILPEWESMVVLRLGKFDGVRGAGFFIIPPFIYSVADIVDRRIVTQQVEATATLTKDNVPTRVTAAVEYKVESPERATIDVVDYRASVVWLATEALKNTIGSMDLKGLLSERDQIAESLRTQIDEGAATYGVDVRAVRITDIDTPQSLVEELAVIARARRAAEAKKVQAEAEILVAEKLKEASDVLTQSEGALKLRELQILNEMSKEESSMVIVYPFGDGNGMGQNIAAATAGTGQLLKSSTKKTSKKK